MADKKVMVLFDVFFTGIFRAVETHKGQLVYDEVGRMISKEWKKDLHFSIAAVDEKQAYYTAYHEAQNIKDFYDAEKGSLFVRVQPQRIISPMYEQLRKVGLAA